MTFLGAGSSHVPPEKVRGCLLDLTHPVGGDKAVWFESVGYRQEEWERLADDLRELAATTEDFDAKPSPHGVKYIARGRSADRDSVPGPSKLSGSRSATIRPASSPPTRTDRD